MVVAFLCSWVPGRGVHIPHPNPGNLLRDAMTPKFEMKATREELEGIVETAPFPSSDLSSSGLLRPVIVTLDLPCVLRSLLGFCLGSLGLRQTG